MPANNSIVWYCVNCEKNFYEKEVLDDEICPLCGSDQITCEAPGIPIDARGMKEITILYDDEDEELKSYSISQLEGGCDYGTCKKKSVAVARIDADNIWGFCAEHWAEVCKR